ncbi:MAG: D-alanyl-D-alanine carboxypeptidase/D-alanyl-D-alanine-endopeptidase [Aeromicrobium sp.]|uniref:D-alanyl-D-alanine carboxypeptidase/D-alanyl-D-alanine endopeptidase n=1 Tax=Aeromicrobium sp. TaxID=1871063 RepID=UPI0039E32B5E
MTNDTGKRVRERKSRPWLTATLWATGVLTTLALIAVTAVAHQAGALNDFLCGGDCGNSDVAAPDGLAAPSPASADVAGEPPVTADAEAVEAAVATALTEPMLGPHVGVSVRQLDGAELLSTSTDTFTPASTTKLLTGFAVLSALDPQQRFTTTTVLDGDRLILVGGGDPFLMATPDDRGFAARADLATLAERTATALTEQGVAPVSLGYDADLFTGPAESPDWESGYADVEVVSPISALWVDRGRYGGVRAADPALAAATLFAEQLAAHGLSVGAPVVASSPDGAAPLAEVKGGTVAQAVERMELNSDNGAAEVLARHAALARGGEASFEGAVTAIGEVLTGAGIDTAQLTQLDGSGLSRHNLMTPSLLTEVVTTAANEAPQLVGDLPVAGFTGSLAERFEGLSGRGLVRTKTGTLSQIHSLAGTVTTADGVVLAVAVMIDQADPAQGLAARIAVDAVVARLADCRCAASGAAA